MKTIIAGSRNITEYATLIKALKKVDWEITTVLSGTARGVDKLGEIFAKENNIPLEKYPAEWDKYGKSAGYKRNLVMAENAEALLALWDGQSKGTKHMIDIAKKHSLKIHIYQI